MPQSDIPGEGHLSATTILTYNGHPFDILDPSTWIFDLDDIATALSNICRFGGHIEFYSVAEHSIRVSKALNQYGIKVQMIGLLHDACEAYIGDMVRPQKSVTSIAGEPVNDFEKGMEYALFQAFDLLDDDFDKYWKLVKQADLDVYLDEAKERPAPGLSWWPTKAKEKFLDRFWSLTALL